MNLKEAHILRILDERVTAGRTSVIETQYGDVRVNKTIIGYCAEYVTPNNDKLTHFAPVPSAAFLRLADQIKAVVSI